MIHIWLSPAKINLFLYVIGKRIDGYHNIQSLFQFLNYGDTIKIRPNKTGTIKLFTQKKTILNADNSILNAAKLLKEKILLYNKIDPTNFGAKIFLHKRIPIGSGLGGASSNAATTLIALNKLWNTQFTLEELSIFSLEIGADVPSFVMGKTAIVEGIGEILHPIETMQKWYLVVYPNIRILTKDIFASPLLTCRIFENSANVLLNSPFSNDFQHIVEKKFIRIKKLLAMLSLYAPSRMTGTGSCVFSEFNNKKSAKKILSLVPKNMQSFITKSVNTSPLHTILQQNKFICP